MGRYVLIFSILLYFNSVVCVLCLIRLQCIFYLRMCQFKGGYYQLLHVSYYWNLISSLRKLYIFRTVLAHLRGAILLYKWERHFQEISVSRILPRGALHATPLYLCKVSAPYFYLFLRRVRYAFLIKPLYNIIDRVYKLISFCWLRLFELFVFQIAARALIFYSSDQLFQGWVVKMFCRKGINQNYRKITTPIGKKGNNAPLSRSR